MTCRNIKKLLLCLLFLSLTSGLSSAQQEPNIPMMNTSGILGRIHEEEKNLK